jgi:hypothetical protein
LLPCLLASIDALIQAVDSYHESYRRVFGRRRKGKKETPKRAADCRHANTHDLVSCISPALLTYSGPLPLTYVVHPHHSAAPAACRRHPLPGGRDAAGRARHAHPRQGQRRWQRGRRGAGLAGTPARGSGLSGEGPGVCVGGFVVFSLVFSSRVVVLAVGASPTA